MNEWWKNSMFASDDDQTDTDTGSDPLDDLVDRWEELTEPFGKVSLAMKLDQAFVREDVQEVLFLVETADEPISRDLARRCLTECMKNATPAEYAALLDSLPEGEYAGGCNPEVDWEPPKKWMADKVILHVSGTLVSLAVAHNRPEILRMLLARGHDVNCASFAATSALVNYAATALSGIPAGQTVPCSAAHVDISGVMHYRGSAFLPGMRRDSLTPLAVAILMGHEECARILLAHGAWTAENAGVGWAMNVAWREKDECYQATREAVVSYGDAATYRPVLDAMLDSSAAQFRAVLKKHSYSVEEYEQMLKGMFPGVRADFLEVENDRHWKWVCSRLNAVGKACPDALAGRWGIQTIFGCANMSGFSLDPLLPYLAGRKLDLTEVRWLPLSARQSKQMLSQLSQHCELVADRNKTKIYFATVERVRAMLRYVTFYESERTGRISDLTEAILRCGNAKLIRSSLENGTIRESAKDLLWWIQDQRAPDVCREAVLTTRRDKTQLLEDWDGPEEDFFAPDMRKSAVNVMGMTANCDPRFADWLNGSVDVPKDLLKDYQQLTVPFSGMMNFLRCSGLCAAAFCGRNEVVETLLDEVPASVDECSNGTYSVWSEGFESYLVDPALLAALGEHWDTVRLLLERGVQPHWDDPLINEFWKKKRGTDLLNEVRFQLGDCAVAK